MKTISEWSKQLPLHVGRNFIKTVIEIEGRDFLKQKAISLPNAVALWFNWNKSSKGRDYWRKIFNKALMWEYDSKPFIVFLKTNYKWVSFWKFAYKWREWFFIRIFGLYLEINY